MSLNENQPAPCPFGLTSSNKSDCTCHKGIPEAKADNAQAVLQNALLRESLEAARSLLIRHHDSNYHIESGMFCPVCSPDGKDQPWDNAFAILQAPSSEHVKQMEREQLAKAIVRDANHLEIDQDARQNEPAIIPLDDPECFCLRCCAIRFLDSLVSSPVSSVERDAQKDFGDKGSNP